MNGNEIKDYCSELNWFTSSSYRKYNHTGLSSRTHLHTHVCASPINLIAHGDAQ